MSDLPNTCTPGFPKKVWAKLSQVNVSEHVKQRGKGKFIADYLSWAWAWAYLMSEYPESSIEWLPIEECPDSTEIIWCRLTIRDGDQYWQLTDFLPVMDHAFNPLVRPNACDRNTARQRCLTKCIGKAGLGFRLYAGEDLPPPALSPEEVDAKKRGFSEALKKATTDTDLRRILEEAKQFCAAHATEADWKLLKEQGVALHTALMNQVEEAAE